MRNFPGGYDGRRNDVATRVCQSDSVFDIRPRRELQHRFGLVRQRIGHAQLRPLTDRWIAAEFSPSQSDKLAGIDLALQYFSGVNSSEVDLVTDSSGHPGTSILESWAGVTTGSAVLALTSLLNPDLTVSQNYWVVAKGNSSTILDIWRDSLVSSRTGLLSLNDGVSWSSTTATTAFSVLGLDPVSVPEPVTLSFFGVGLFGAGILRMRGKRAARAA
jgi:hypothetical protein